MRTLTLDHVCCTLNVALKLTVGAAWATPESNFDLLLLMDESSYWNLPTSHLLGSVPAVVDDESEASYGRRGGGGRGYQTLGPPT
ncbi:hypothetical protein Goari_021153, partial [Gossypium aridum]|nr:hypothetical protein [Gossypium aridum]